MKVLIVSLPNDLGSRTIETNLLKIIGPHCDTRLFRFAAHDADQIDNHIDNRKNICRRFQDTLKLRSEVRKAVKEGRKVLFYNVSPALFSLGSWRGGQVYITMDWAGRLFGTPASMFKQCIWFLHKRIFNSCDGLLPMTNAMAECLLKEYKVPQSQIHLVPSLFDVEHFDPGDIRREKKLRVLYVGGDVKRKGGDLIYNAFARGMNQFCNLTMVTNHEFADLPGFRLERNIRYGTSEHLNLMQNHDIFVLPTFRDSGPQVIGEAAAAGLAVVTTRQALGAVHVVKEGINGHIADDPDSCIKTLQYLLTQPETVMRMRMESLKHMRTQYSKNKISDSYLNAISKTSSR